MPSKSILLSAKEILKNKNNVIIAIDGRCAAGKTTLAKALAEAVDCNVIHTDDFFLPSERKTAERLSETGGNIDYERFFEEVIVPLKKNIPFSYRPYSCSLGEFTKPVSIIPKEVTIIEGTYSLHPYFKDYADIKVFIDISPSEQEKRLLLRNKELFERFVNEWIPMEEKYFDEFGIRKKCNLIF